MTRPFWIAAISGTLMVAMLVSRVAENQVEAAIMVTFLLGVLTVLTLIDVKLQ